MPLIGGGGSTPPKLDPDIGVVVPSSGHRMFILEYDYNKYNIPDFKVGDELFCSDTKTFYICNLPGVWTKIECKDVDWFSIKNKPICFNACSHTHDIDEINNLQNILDSLEYLIENHSHEISDITGLQNIIALINNKFNDKADLVNGKVPLSQLPAELREIRVKGTITDRDNIPDIFESLKVHVLDASDDPEIESGWAEYIYVNGKGWVLTASQNDDTQIILDWDLIENKPETFPPEDHTHKELHEHSNITSLNKIEYDPITNLPLWDSGPWPGSSGGGVQVSRYEFLYDEYDTSKKTLFDFTSWKNINITEEIFYCRAYVHIRNKSTSSNLLYFIKNINGDELSGIVAPSKLIVISPEFENWDLSYIGIIDAKVTLELGLFSDVGVLAKLHQKTINITSQESTDFINKFSISNWVTSNINTNNYILDSTVNIQNESVDENLEYYLYDASNKKIILPTKNNTFKPLDNNWNIFIKGKFNINIKLRYLA